MLSNSRCIWLFAARHLVAGFRREISASANWMLLDQLCGQLRSAPSETVADESKVQSGNCARVQLSAGDMRMVFLSVR